MSFGGYTVILHFTPAKHHRKEKEHISRISCFWLLLEWKPADSQALTAYDWKRLLYWTVPLRHALFDDPGSIHCGERTHQSVKQHLFTFHTERESYKCPACLVGFQSWSFVASGGISSLIIRQWITVASFGVVFSCQCSRDVRAFGKGVDEGTVRQSVLHPSDFFLNKQSWLQLHHVHLQAGLQRPTEQLCPVND